MQGDPELRLCLDFVNTEGEPRNEAPDRLATGELFLGWAEKHGLLDRAASLRLADELQRSPRKAESFLRRAVALRGALLGILTAAIAGERPPRGDLELLNRELAPALAARRLAWDGTAYAWQAEPGGSATLHGALRAVAISAARLLRSDLLERVKECRSETCSWLFIDRSRNRSRRWCDMADCGNRAKARRYYRRHARR